MFRSLARLLRFEGYENADIQYSSRDKVVKFSLDLKEDKPFLCYRCKSPLGRVRGKHKLQFEELSIMGCKTFVSLWRRKGHCSTCKKARSEDISFLSEESPHLSKAYAEWLGTMCEFAAVSRVGEFCGQDNMTVRRVDYARMKRLLRRYKIPPVRRMAVDEVYARKKARSKDESREKRFFTIVTDLDTKRVIWVSEGRSKEALDQFFKLIGKDACKKIIVAAMDQFEGYANSVKGNCKNATVVWDKFHIMQNFEKALNEARKTLHQELSPKDPTYQMTRGKYRFLFLKRDADRDVEEKAHITEVLKANEKFLQLEIIKEAMLRLFDEPDADSGKALLEVITQWVIQTRIGSLRNWFANLWDGWDTLKNYFTFRVTSALAEGQNNVIKSLKRRSFGFRNMEYFRLKIMQVCGYLNSRYIKELAC